jgi:hypothetical protein
MRNSLEKLKLLGKMPNEDLDNDSHLSNKYRELLMEIEEPISIEMGYALLSFLPSKRFYGLEFEILSKIETIELNNEKQMKSYENLINSCPNEEIRDNLIVGYENWKEDC